MENTLKLVGKNSNEIFTLRYPSTLLDFSEFDFSYYAGAAIDVCNEALKNGTPDFDKISEIKKDIQSAHCFLQYSTRASYDKIVFDCWIDYVCRRDNIGNSALWNRFIRCKTQFEKIIFQRLCDFRYKRAVNEWLNVIRIQDYAKAKMDFVFSEGMKSSHEAEERRNYFDLMFSVTARELGCRLEDLGVTKYYSICRTPGSPFMFPNISKEIIRHVLAGFDYSDDYSDVIDYSESADEIAMDAFSRMRAGLPPELSTYQIPPGKFENLAEKLYMPCGLKAVIDLEIDAIIGSGIWLARCKRCGRFFPKTKDAAEDYCTRRSIPAGKTCLEVYEEENPRPKISDELLDRCKQVTDEMYSRVDKTMSAHEYNSWYTYLEAMKQKIENGEISSSELESFLDYSLEVDISKSKPIVEVAKKEPEAPKERVVKPFIPERISRSEIKQFESPDEPEEPAKPASKPSREGFFTSPSVQRQKNERPQISHIIRNGESLGKNNPSMPDPAGFKPFESQFRAVQPANREQPVPQPVPQPEVKQRPDAYENFKRLEERLEAERRLREERSSFKPIAEGDRGEFVEDFPRTSPRREPPRREPPRAEREEQRIQYSEPEEPNYGYEDLPQRTRSDYSRPDERFEEPRPSRRFVEETEREAPQPETREVREMRDRRAEQYGYREAEEDRQPESIQPAQTGQPDQPNQLEQPQQPEPAERRPRVIRKNAAAISAYGKMAGKPVSTMNPVDAAPPPVEETVSRPSADREQPPRRLEREAEPPQLDSEMLEPFKDIGSIFDVLEQSENSLNAVGRLDEPFRERYADRGTERTSDHTEPFRERREEHDTERSPDHTERSPAPPEPRTIANGEVPSGIWTEDRRLFGNTSEAAPSPERVPTRERNIPEQETDETETAHEKRHTRSSKTQRLYDVIMREPDDNPNFRRKK